MRDRQGGAREPENIAFPMSFEKLDLMLPLQNVVATQGYTVPTPIQQRSIPHVLRGRDLLGCAQTGTGKTAAFALPIVQRLVAGSGKARIRALILSPTRELAAQIGDCFHTFGRPIGVRHAVVYGGVNQNKQVRSLTPVPDVLVATPGRLLDLCSQRLIALDAVETLVLDEADRMLDMGFIHDVRKIVAMVPRRRQTLMFSATLPADIEVLGRNILTDPVRVSVAPASSVADTIEQFVYFVEKQSKRALLEHVLEDRAIRRALVFTRTKHGAERLAVQLKRARVAAGAIHGNKSQGQRQRALEGFRQGHIRVLVATDVAARGLDVDDVTHVINFDLPDSAESYVHRIGRTGRAGALGTALSFCDAAEQSLLRGVEKLIRLQIPVVQEHPYVNREVSSRRARADGGAAAALRVLPLRGAPVRRLGATAPARKQDQSPEHRRSDERPDNGSRRNRGVARHRFGKGRASSHRSEKQQARQSRAK